MVRRFYKMETKIYINGIKASKKDIKTLIEWLDNGKTTAKAHITKRGNIAIVTDIEEE
jgi:hypothetical protein